MNLDDYKRFMLTPENMANAIHVCKRETIAKKTKKINEQKNNARNDLRNDHLFWIFYTMTRDLPERTTVIVEKQLKIEYVEKMRLAKASTAAIEGSLANDNKIDVKTFLALCEFEQLNVVYIIGRTYYERMSSINGPIHVVYQEKEEYGKYVYKLNAELNRDMMLNIDKPIRAISAYKLDELEDMCARLGLEITEKRTKANLYRAIVTCL